MLHLLLFGILFLAADSCPQRAVASSEIVPAELEEIRVESFNERQSPTRSRGRLLLPSALASPTSPSPPPPPSKRPSILNTGKDRTRRIISADSMSIGSRIGSLSGVRVSFSSSSEDKEESHSSASTNAVPLDAKEAFWRNFTSAIRMQASSIATEFARIAHEQPWKYYNNLDRRTSKAFAALDIRSRNFLEDRNQISVNYGWNAAHLNLIQVISLSSDVRNHQLVRSLPYFAGILFWRGKPIKPFPPSILDFCFRRQRVELQEWSSILPNQAYSLKELGLSADESFVGSRKLFDDFFEPINDHEEFRVILVCRSCRYVQPFMPYPGQGGYDAAVVHPPRGRVHVVEMVLAKGLKILILTETTF